MRRSSFHAVVALLVGFYKAFVLMHLWNWFVAPIFHISDISLFQALGLFFIAAVFTNQSSELGHEYWSKRTVAILDLCIPEDRKAQAEHILGEKDEESWREVGQWHFNEIASTTVVLVLGWGVHTYLH